jgi:hypothetical protein
MTQKALKGATRNTEASPPESRLAAANQLRHNSSGQLGDGTANNSSIPVQVSNLAGAVAIAGGGLHSLASDSTGRIWAWGCNSSGQLGDGTATNSSMPVQVSELAGVVAIAGGGEHNLALDSTGEVWAWGVNSSGQLGWGWGSSINSFTPVRVSHLAGAIAIAAGTTHSLAIARRTQTGNIITKMATSTPETQTQFRFTSSYSANGFQLADNESNDSGPLAPGYYSVTEETKVNWFLAHQWCVSLLGTSKASAYSSSLDIDLAAGDTVTCTFQNVNTAPPLKWGKIAVMNYTQPPGDPTSFAFTSTYNANGFQLADREWNDSGALVPGSYSVAEVLPSGWSLGLSCSGRYGANWESTDGTSVTVDLTAGNTIICYFFNAKIDASSPAEGHEPRSLQGELLLLEELRP